MPHVRSHGPRPDRPAPALRLRRLPPRPGTGRRIHPLRHRHSRRPADRSGQVRLLPGAGRGPRRPHRRGEPADLADAGPGGGRGGTGHFRRESHQRTQRRRAVRRSAPAARGQPPAAVPVARAAGALRAGAAGRRHSAVAARGGRGALHRGVGARLPAELPDAARGALPARPAAGCRPDGERYARAFGRKSHGRWDSRKESPASTSARSTARICGSGSCRVSDDRNRLQALRRLLSGDDRMAIVYAPTRSVTEGVARALAAAGHRAAPYHAGLDRARRAAILDAFLSDRIDVVVATCAFGMGIDKPTVRLVVHWTLPPTPESYYQEAGRAGRDGEFARCVLLWHRRDATLHRRQLDVTFPPRRLLERIWQSKGPVSGVPANVRESADRLARELRPDLGPVDWTGVRERRRRAEDRLRAMERYAEGRGCRRRALVGYFGEKLASCAGCDRCRSQPAARPLTGAASTRLTRLRQAMGGRAGPWGGCLLEPEVLHRLARNPPRDAASLADVAGIGPAIAERYGATILGALGVEAGGRGSDRTHGGRAGAGGVARHGRAGDGRPSVRGARRSRVGSACVRRTDERTTHVGATRPQGSGPSSRTRSTVRQGCWSGLAGACSSGSAGPALLPLRRQPAEVHVLQDLLPRALAQPPGVGLHDEPLAHQRHGLAVAVLVPFLERGIAADLGAPLVPSVLSFATFMFRNMLNGT